MPKKRLFILIIVTLIFIGTVSGFIYFYPKLDKPLGPPLKGNLTEQPSSNLSEQKSPNEISAPEQTTIPDQTPSTIPNSLQDQANQLLPLCGNKPVLFILLAGIDYRGDNYLYGLADSIRIVRVDFVTHKVTAMTLERDIWVEIPGISDHYGITQGKLNQAYFYGTPGMGYYDGPGGGAGLLASTLKLNFNLDVDNYVVVSMAAFSRGIDALGGIDVYLPYDVDGAYRKPTGEIIWNNGYFYSGMNHLDGTRAMHLARIRMGYTTIFRNQNQDRIFKGIFKKITSPTVIFKVPELIRIMNETVLTDLTPKQISDMVCLASKMNSGDFELTAIPESEYTEGEVYNPDIHGQTFTWKIDPEVIRSYISRFVNGQLP